MGNKLVFTGRELGHLDKRLVSSFQQMAFSPAGSFPGFKDTQLFWILFHSMIPLFLAFLNVFQRNLKQSLLALVPPSSLSLKEGDYGCLVVMESIENFKPVENTVG